MSLFSNLFYRLVKFAAIQNYYVPAFQAFYFVIRTYAHYLPNVAAASVRFTRNDIVSNLKITHTKKMLLMINSSSAAKYNICARSSSDI